jgi:hypothetical protein
LAQEGWEFREIPGTPGSIPGGVVALTLGAVLRGAGHFAVGDRKTWVPLLASQPIAIGMIAGGARLARAGTSDRFEPVGTALAVLGASVLAAGWATDVLGSFKGGGGDLPANTEEIEGLAFEALYTTSAPGSPETSNLLVVRVPWITPHTVVRPEVQSTTTLGFRHVALQAGWRQNIGRLRTSHLELRFDGLEQYSATAGAGRTVLGGTLATRTDIGEFFPHVRGLHWTNGIGVLFDYPYFDHEGRVRLQRANRVIRVPVESRLSVNVSRGVSISAGYRHRRDLLVGGIGRNMGAVDLRVGLVPLNRIGFEVAVEQGARTRIWIGFRWFAVGGRVE